MANGSLSILLSGPEVLAVNQNQAAIEGNRIDRDQEVLCSADSSVSQW